MVFTAGVAWLILGVGHLSWNWFAVVCGLPALIAAALLWFVVPESPLWLARAGRATECQAALVCIAKWNQRPIPYLSQQAVDEDPGDADLAEVQLVSVKSESDNAVVTPPVPMAVVPPVPLAVDQLAGSSRHQHRTAAIRSATSSSAAGSGSCRKQLPACFYALDALHTLYCGRGHHVRSSILLSIVWFTISLAWYSMAVW